MALLNFLKPKITVVTHNGTFHADELFGCAVLSLWAEQQGKRLKIIRTRDKAIIDSADIVLDVGMTYEPEKNRYDHHQAGGAGKHENGIPYASFGLIWKHFGEKICSKEVAKRIEEKIVMPIDARDNGVNISVTTELGIMDYRLTNAIFVFNSTLKEGEKETPVRFNKALTLATEILTREIAWNEEAIEGARLTKKAIEDQNTPEILILDERIKSEEEVSKHAGIKFIASKSKENDHWSVISVRDNLEDYNSRRAEFPKEWRGLRDEELSKVSGVPGAIFCHVGGWFLKTENKEAAIALAKKALAAVGTDTSAS